MIHRRHSPILILPVIIIPLVFIIGLQSGCEEPPTKSCLNDTTSHNFVWEMDTLGTHGLIRDVFAISDDDVWIVGEIHNYEVDPDDTTQLKNIWYNAAHWDGIEWKLMNVPSVLFTGDTVHFAEMYAVFAFGSDNVWMFSETGAYSRWDGTSWSTQYVPARSGSILKIWGSSPTDIFFVGNNGSITHYNGTRSTEMESGTDIDLLDVWGTCESEVWIAGWSRDVDESVILHYNGVKWSTFYEKEPFDINVLPTDRLLGPITSVWQATDCLDSLVVVGVWGAFQVPVSNNGSINWSYPWRWDIGVGDPMGFPFRVRGWGYNDVFVAGQRSSILHYNGSTWKNYLEFYDDTITGIWFRSISLGENITYIVGDNKVMKAARTD